MGIVSAYMSNNRVKPAYMATLIAATHATLVKLSRFATAPEIEKPNLAQIKKSISPDALISFLDGKPYKTLKRHLTTNGLTFEQYRERYGLPRDYPATAAIYSAHRSELARSLGLGQNRRKFTSSAPEPTPDTETPKRAVRPRKAKKPAQA